MLRNVVVKKWEFEVLYRFLPVGLTGMVFVVAVVVAAAVAAVAAVAKGDTLRFAKLLWGAEKPLPDMRNIVAIDSSYT